jgi:hypothetical protein
VAKPKPVTIHYIDFSGASCKGKDKIKTLPSLKALAEFKRLPNVHVLHIVKETK